MVTVTDQEIDDVIDLWTKLRVDLGWKGFVKTKRNAKLRASALRFLKWAKKNKVPPGRYIEGCADYYRRKQEDLPGLSFLMAKPREFRERIVRRGVSIEGDRRIQVVDKAERKLRASREKFKSFYVGREEMCARMQLDSGGFNAESRWCQRCPAKTSCIEFGRA